MELRASDVISIGDLAARTGVSVSAIRFYEAKGLIHPFRNAGRQRRFLRSDIRRVSFVLIAQQIGLTIEQIQAELAKLPDGRTPTQGDWKRISDGFKRRLVERIAALSRTRDRLDNCIGCGCLSLRKCALYNPQDRAAARGAGPRYVMGDVAVASNTDTMPNPRSG